MVLQIVVTPDCFGCDEASLAKAHSGLKVVRTMTGSSARRAGAPLRAVSNASVSAAANVEPRLPPMTHLHNTAAWTQFPHLSADRGVQLTAAPRPDRQGPSACPGICGISPC